jgi:hypothetical protein
MQPMRIRDIVSLALMGVLAAAGCNWYQIILLVVLYHLAALTLMPVRTERRMRQRAWAQ